MTPTVIAPAPSARAVTRSRAQRRGFGSAAARAPLPAREVLPIPDAGDVSPTRADAWLEPCCAFARFYLRHPERARLPRTDAIAAALVALEYLRTLARNPGAGRQRSAVVRTSLHQLTVGLGRIWGWDLSDYPEEPGRRERDVVDRHAKGLRARLRPLVEGDLLEHRVLLDEALEERGTELVLLPSPTWSPHELAIGRQLHENLKAAARRPGSRARALVLALRRWKRGGADRGRARNAEIQRARIRKHQGQQVAASLEDLADFPSYAPTLSPHPAPRNPEGLSFPLASLAEDESSRGSSACGRGAFGARETRDHTGRWPGGHSAMSGEQQDESSREGGPGPYPWRLARENGRLAASARFVEGWDPLDGGAAPGALTLAEAWHWARGGRELEPMLLVGRPMREHLVKLADDARREAGRGAQLMPLGELFLTDAARREYPHPHATIRALQREIRRAKAVRELQQPATATMIRRAWARLDRYAPDWLCRAPSGAPLVAPEPGPHGEMRLAVSRPLQPAELFDRRVQSAIAAAATIVHRGPIAQVELEHPGGLAARIATTHGRHSGLADGSRIHVPGHNVIAGW